MNQTTRKYLSKLEDLFSFSPADAQGAAARFHEEMKHGLDGQTSSLRMLPSYVGRPTGTEKGQFLALDLGGTNLRVLAVRLDGRGGAEITAVNRLAVPETVMRGSGEALFDFLAEGVALFLEEHGLDSKEHRDLAFTFSFPVAQSAVNAGVLLNWTKGFTAADVAGQNVVALLSDALRRKRIEEVSVTALVNDTVGTLATKSYTDPSCDMGVILGTGTNACYPEKTGRLAKGLFPLPRQEMILNLEWGNFDKLDTNACDQALDRMTLNPGCQRMEKMVSGMYIGELVRLILLDMTDQGILLQEKHRPVLAREHSVSSEQMSLSALGEDFFAAIGIPDVSDRDRDAAAHVCRIVSRRSARIAGAALAAVVAWMDAHLEKKHTIAIDGSLFEKYPGYPENMRCVLEEFFACRADRISLCTTSDGSGIGAAIIAAVASFGQEQKHKPALQRIRKNR
jgi:hexokinase